MKLSSHASALRIAHEGITNFASLYDFDKKNIQNLTRVCKNSIPAIETDATNSIAAEDSVFGPSISSTSVSRFIVAIKSSKHYSSISRVMNLQKIGYASVLVTFKVEHEAYLSIKDDDDSKVPKINDR